MVDHNFISRLVAEKKKSTVRSHAVFDGQIVNGWSMLFVYVVTGEVVA